MPELIEIINILSRVTTVLFMCFVPLLLASYRLLDGASRNKSNFLSIIIFFAANTTMYGYKFLLIWLFGEENNYQDLYLFCWFMGFTWFDLIAIRLLYIFHKKENLRIERLGQFIALSFMTLGLLQLTLYSEILITNSMKTFEDIYRFAIPVVNFITLSICAFTIVFGLAKIHLQDKYPSQYKRIKTWLP